MTYISSVFTHQVMGMQEKALDFLEEALKAAGQGSFIASVQSKNALRGTCEVELYFPQVHENLPSTDPVFSVSLGERRIRKLGVNDGTSAFYEAPQADIFSLIRTLVSVMAVERGCSDKTCSAIDQALTNFFNSNHSSCMSLANSEHLPRL
jgi:hypothetical protein